MRRTILVVHSDTHGGHKLGLMNPAVVLYDEDPISHDLIEYSPEPTESQRVLWEFYSEDIARIQAWAGEDEILVLHNGDMCQGKKYPRALVSTRDADQYIIAQSNLQPWYQLPNVKHVRLVAGTGAHNFEENSAEILVGRNLSQEYPNIDTKVIRHGVMEYNGLLVDYAHHGPHPGSRDWLRGNVTAFYLRDLLYQEMHAGRKAPTLVLRSHYHQRVKVMLDWDGQTVYLMITPSYCMLDDHALQAARSPSRISIGMYAYEIVDGRITDILECVHTIDARIVEVV